MAEVTQTFPNAYLEWKWHFISNITKRSCYPWVGAAGSQAITSSNVDKDLWRYEVTPSSEQLRRDMVWFLIYWHSFPSNTPRGNYDIAAPCNDGIMITRCVCSVCEKTAVSRTFNGSHVTSLVLVIHLVTGFEELFWSLFGGEWFQLAGATLHTVVLAPHATTDVILLNQNGANAWKTKVGGRECESDLEITILGLGVIWKVFAKWQPALQIRLHFQLGHQNITVVWGILCFWRHN